MIALIMMYDIDNDDSDAENKNDDKNDNDADDKHDYYNDR